MKKEVGNLKMKKSLKTVCNVFICSMLFIALCCFSIVAMAEDISVTLKPASGYVGDSIEASGMDKPNQWITVKIMDSSGNIVYINSVMTDENGNYSDTFKIPDVPAGELKVTAGYDTNVSKATLNVLKRKTGGNEEPKEEEKEKKKKKEALLDIERRNLAKKEIKPTVGGTIKIGKKISADIPAGAIKGTSKIEVGIERLDTPPSVSSGFRFLGQTYEFSVGESDSYTFNKPITLTFEFDSLALKPGEKPQVGYYDEELRQWIALDGKLNGSTIIISIDHFTKFAVLAKEEEKTSVDIIDIAGHWGEENIRKLIEAEVIKGYSDNTFRPNNNITRAEFVTILTKALKMKTKAGKVFEDTVDHWAKEYIETSAAHGIVSGYSDKAFGPNDDINREQMAVMIVKAAKLEKTAGESVFKDTASISLWARESIATAYTNKLISGYPDKTFRPKTKTTRAEAAAVIVKILNYGGRSNE